MKDSRIPLFWACTFATALAIPPAESITLEKMSEFPIQTKEASSCRNL